jgi:hypothetical protein
MIEYALPGIFSSNLTFVIFKGAAKVLEPIFGKDKVLSVDLDKKDTFSETKQIIQKRLSENYSIFSYVEKTYYERKNIYTMTKFRSGMFRIAQELNIPITPVVCEHLEYDYGIIRNEAPRVYILKPFYVSNLEADMEKCWKNMGRYLRMTRYKI